jgi:hypothetical protein
MAAVSDAMDIDSCGAEEDAEGLEIKVADSAHPRWRAWLNYSAKHGLTVFEVSNGAWTVHTPYDVPFTPFLSLTLTFADHADWLASSGGKAGSPSASSPGSTASAGSACGTWDPAAVLWQSDKGGPLSLRYEGRNRWVVESQTETTAFTSKTVDEDALATFDWDRAFKTSAYTTAQTPEGTAYQFEQFPELECLLFTLDEAAFRGEYVAARGRGDGGAGAMEAGPDARGGGGDGTQGPMDCDDAGSGERVSGGGGPDGGRA